MYLLVMCGCALQGVCCVFVCLLLLFVVCFICLLWVIRCSLLFRCALCVACCLLFGGCCLLFYALTLCVDGRSLCILRCLFMFVDWLLLFIV